MTINAALVNRNGLSWLLVSQILVILPLLFYLPWWILGLWIGCAIWRVQIYRMKFNYPTRLVKIILMVVIGIGIYFSRGTILGLEGGIVLLIAAFSLKLIELKTKRDALVVLYIGFLVVVTAYLYDNSFVLVSYSLLPVISLLAALIGLNQTKLAINPFGNIKLACILILQAVPLMLVLFFFFPRLEPLWTLPMPKNKQQATGISNKMTPGEMANLAQSSELVFRAIFKGAIPPKNKLYWRVLTLETYNGRTWQQAWDVGYRDSYRGPAWRRNSVTEDVSYNVIMQPNLHSWVVVLDTPQTLPTGVIRSPDFHLERNKPVESIYSYELTSSLNALREPDKTPRINIDKQLSTNNSDPRARVFGQQLRETYKGNTSQVVEALLKHFHNEPYHYTLQTPDLGENSIDTFFFDTRRGFCEHYASATAFILRAANIPARVVLGYQGGEINTAGNFVQVRQFEAHAWVEYWQQGKGWVTIDPTFQVAPSRIELGLSEALSQEEQQQLGNNALLGYGTDSLLAKLRMNWENFNNEWDIFIAGYNGGQQKDILQKLFGQTNLVYLGVLLVVGIILVSGIWLLLLLKPWKREKNPVLKCYEQFESLLARKGVRRDMGEGPVDFANRAAKDLPLYREQIEAFNKAFVAQQYAELGSMHKLNKALVNLRKKFSWKKRRFHY